MSGIVASNGESISQSESGSESDECQWYFLSFVTDAAIGTMINLYLLSHLEYFARRYVSLSDFRSGEYGNPPQTLRWLKQLCAWLTIVSLSKCVVWTVLLMFSSALYAVLSHVLFDALRSNAYAELLTVMVIVPAALNSVQWWVQDSFLKSSAGDAPLKASPSDAIKDTSAKVSSSSSSSSSSASTSAKTE